MTLGFIDVILAMSENLATISMDRKSAYKIMMSNSREQEWTATKICRFFHSLKQKKYIEIVKTDTGESIVLTNKAKLKLLDRISEKSKWDGKYRFVSFDIPEVSANQRKKFRYAIKRLGFRQVQKSLWVCNKNVGEYVELAAQEYGVDKYVAYFISEKSDIDSHLSSLFKKNKKD